MIKSAQTLAGAGEFDKAIEGQRRQVPGERGYEQAMAEKDADFPEYMLNRRQMTRPTRRRPHRPREETTQ
jgi:hypothetical protein